MNRPWRIAVALGLAVAALLLSAATLSAHSSSPSAAALTWYVDDDTCPAVGAGSAGDPFCRIQDAVDAAAEGDEILVAAGTYTGSAQVVASDGYTHTQVVFIDKDLILRGGFASGDWATSDPRANPTTIDAQRHGRGVTIHGAEGASVTVDGFVVTRGDYTGLGNPEGVGAQICRDTGIDCGGGLYVRRGTLTLRNATVADNIASTDEGEGGGLYVWDPGGGPVTIEDSEFISNSASVGGGIAAQYMRNPIIIRRCQFVQNSAGAAAGVELYDMLEPVTIADTSFISNTADSAGGAWVRLVPNDGYLQMERVSFVGNEADTDAALLVSAAGSGARKATIQNTLFARNRAPSPTDETAVVGVWRNFTSIELEILHSTAADNEVPTFFYGATATGAGEWMTVTVTNTLLVSFTNAFAAEERGSGEALIRHTQLLISDVPTLHLTVDGTPTYEDVGTKAGDPLLDESYHLQVGSAAIDAGIEAGVTDDIDRDPRPIGPPDIGADEWQLKAFVPLILRGSL